MQVLEKTKEEIKTKAEKMSDFLKMEYLESCLIKNLNIDVIRYCYKELSRLYEKRKMFSEAAKYACKFQGVCINQKEKTNAQLKEIELLIKGGFYDNADMASKKLLSSLNEREKIIIKKIIISIYKIEASKLEISNKNSSALKIYERLINLVSEDEKNEIKTKLFILYKKLGKIKESLKIEKELLNN